MFCTFSCRPWSQLCQIISLPWFYYGQETTLRNMKLENSLSMGCYHVVETSWKVNYMIIIIFFHSSMKMPFLLCLFICMSFQLYFPVTESREIQLKQGKNIDAQGPRWHQCAMEIRNKLQLFLLCTFKFQPTIGKKSFPDDLTFSR